MMEWTKLNLDSFALTGKVSWGDFTTAYASKTTITLWVWPSWHTSIILDDIERIRQVAADWNVIATYARNEEIMDVTANVLTIAWADFKSTDTFIIITNVGRKVSISGDINIDSTTIPANSLIGKTSNWDFNTAYNDATKITVTNMPSTHSSLIAEDIVTIVQFSAAWEVIIVYTRDDAVMSVAANVITVVWATFGATDTFVIYTNVVRDLVVEIEWDVNVDNTDTKWLVGKSADWDFTTAYLWSETITIWAW